MDRLELIINRIKEKYYARAVRLDAREKDRKHTGKKGKVWITINHQPVPVGENGLEGKIGKKIEKTEAEAKANRSEKTEKAPEENRSKTTEKTEPPAKKESDKPAEKKLTPEERKKKEFEDKQKNLRKEVNNRLKDRRYSRKMYDYMQSKHYKGGKRYVEAKAEGKDPSFLTIPDSKVRDIVKKHIDSGTVLEHFNDEGDVSYRIYFEEDDIIGNCVRPRKGNRERVETPVKSGIIILSRKGYHVVPVMEKEFPV